MLLGRLHGVAGLCGMSVHRAAGVAIAERTRDPPLQMPGWPAMLCWDPRQMLQMVIMIPVAANT